jgi:CheY-like chemotaxis protein
VALIDYRLGARSGLDLLLAARAAGDLPPAIVLTGAGDQAIDAAAQAAGAADFLIKGRLDAAGLERAIRYTLDRARQRAALMGAQDFLQATLDALRRTSRCSTHAGRSSRSTRPGGFATANGSPRGLGSGPDYLAVCDAAAATGEAGAEEVAVAIRDLLAGQGESLRTEVSLPRPR